MRILNFITSFYPDGMCIYSPKWGYVKHVNDARWVADLSGWESVAVSVEDDDDVVDDLLDLPYRFKLSETEPYLTSLMGYPLIFN